MGEGGGKQLLTQRYTNDGFKMTVMLCEFVLLQVRKCVRRADLTRGGTAAQHTPCTGTLCVAAIYEYLTNTEIRAVKHVLVVLC